MMKKNWMRWQTVCLLMLCLVTSAVAQAANDEQKLIGLWESFQLGAEEGSTLYVNTMGVEFKADKTYLMSVTISMRIEVNEENYQNAFFMNFKTSIRGTWFLRDGQIYAKPIPSSLQGGLASFEADHTNLPMDELMIPTIKKQMEEMNLLDDLKEALKEQINWVFKFVDNRFLVTDVETESPTLFIKK